MVASRGDMNHEFSLFEMFRLQRIELNEAKGCRDLAAFLENALILQGMVAQTIDTGRFI